MRAPVSINRVHAALPDRAFYRLNAYRYYWLLEPETRYLAEMVGPGSIAVDVGACWGAYLYWMARVAKQVVAFEPNPALVEYLRRVAPPGVQVHHAALSDRNGQAILKVPRSGTDPYALATIATPEAGFPSSYEEISVPRVRLDDLGLHPGLIKIDVEGHEEEVLNGAAETIARSQPNLLIEVEERHKAGSVERVTKQLGELGYDGWFHLDGEWLPVARFDLDVHQNASRVAVTSGQYVNNFFFSTERPSFATPRARIRPARRGSRAELVRLFLRERRDPEPFHQRLADEAVASLGRDLRGQRVVDLGCGPGHYTRALRRAGASVVPVDLSVAEFHLPGGPPGSEVVGDGTHLPIAAGSADGLLCSNMLEHTPDPSAVFDEIERVVRPGGWVWLSWTNWYSPWGGHDVSPWHYLGPERGTNVYRFFAGKEPKNVPGRSLFPLHVGPTLRAIEARRGLRLLDAAPRYWSSQRWILRVPGVREIATWNCLLLLERTTG